MGTRGVIARTDGDSFKGRYHHWDSYPQGLGKTLYELYNGHFKRDASAMLKTLIDDHNGWSTINGTDFDKEPGFGGDDTRPHCYCHGDRHEEDAGYVEGHGDDWGAEWAYAINEQTANMFVYRRVYGDGPFGDRWSLRGLVDLNADEPDWHRM